MKLSLEEKRLLVSALTFAVSATPSTESGAVERRWRYQNLRKKIETAIRNEKS